MSKRQAVKPAPPRKAPRDRKQLWMALLAIFIVVSMLLSGLMVLFYNQ